VKGFDPQRDAYRGLDDIVSSMPGRAPPFRPRSAFWLRARSPTGPLIASGLATAGVAAAALSIVPGGVFACAGLAYLAHERFSEARRRARSRDLLLALGGRRTAVEADRRLRGLVGPHRGSLTADLR